MHSRDDSLLYVISSDRNLPWRRFKVAFSHLLPTQPGARSGDDEQIRHFRRRTLRLLSSLGHCDYDFGSSGGRVYVAPPVLARLPLSGRPSAVLAGARYPYTVARIRESARTRNTLSVDVESQRARTPLVPTRVVVQADDAEDLSWLAAEQHLSYQARPPAWLLAKMSGSVFDYLESVHIGTVGDLNWPRSDFKPSSLTFAPPTQDPAQCRLTRYTDPVKNVPAYVLTTAERSSFVDPDWGRYAVLREHEHAVLVYDAQRFMMAVPLTTPLPRLLARSLALCSGYAPLATKLANAGLARKSALGYYCYRSVPPEIANEVASKVGQDLAPHAIEIGKGDRIDA